MGEIWRISGPLIIAKDMRGTQVYEVVADVGIPTTGRGFF